MDSLSNTAAFFFCSNRLFTHLCVRWPNEAQKGGPLAGNGFLPADTERGALKLKQKVKQKVRSLVNQVGGSLTFGATGGVQQVADPTHTERWDK